MGAIDAPTTRSRQRITWEKLGERTRLMLQRLNDCILLDEDDLCALVWPEAMSRQARAERLSRWQAEQYIQPIAAPGGRCYQLGRSGARLLREAGFPRIAPVRPVAERVRPGLLLATRLGTSLIIGAQNDPQVTGVAWLAQPFSGSTARPDGVAAIQYRIATQPAIQGCAPWLPELATEGYTPPSGEALQRLVIEIDSGTESQRQLIQRAKAWRARWEAMPHLPATHTLILWLTTGTIERLNTIWEAWIGHAFLPAFFVTQSDLDADIPNGALGAAALRAGPLPLALARPLRPPALTQTLGDERALVAQRSATTCHVTKPGREHR